MNTKTVTIQGVQFDISQPYAEGHILNAAEAKYLNQVRAENIGNNVRKEITETKEANGGEVPPEMLESLRAKVAEYDRTYEFRLTSNGGGARIVDPVEREAISIAKAAVRTQIKKENRKLLKADEQPTSETDITRERFDELVAEVAQRADVLKIAKRRVKEATEIDLGAAA